MALYAISDLHLDLNGDKPMDIFGDKWVEHDEKIKENWYENIEEDDTVLIAGDLSWSMKMEDGIKELEWVHNLPGKKILIRGNHDYWWGSISKLNSLYNNMNFIQNNFFHYEDYAICGARGWVLPEGDNFTAKDEKIYKRELVRLRLSVDSALKAGYNKFIIMLHYPPFIDTESSNGFTEILDEIRPAVVIYGHLHGMAAKNAFQGFREGVKYIITSSDCINFNPVRIL